MRWLLLGAVVVGATEVLGMLGLPSPTLFAALLAGVGVALAWPDRFALPRPAFTAAQAVTGVTLGAYLQSSSLSAVAGSWLPVALVSLATLGLSLAAGAVLARRTELDAPTAALGMVAGGASGIVSMADDLGADDRLVAFMQYLRVLVVVLLTPAVVAVAGGGDGNSPAGPHEALLGHPTGWLVTLAVAPAGALAARAVRVPAASLLGPMTISGALTLAGVSFAVPPLLRDTAFALIGLQVGLRFTLATVRQLGRLLAPVLVALGGLLVGCFGLAVVLELTTPLSLRDAYLATTPGGLYAVLAIAVGAGANTTFILAAQALRLLVMVLLAPVAVRWLARRG